MSIVRSCVRSVVRSPVRGVFGGDDVFGPASLFSSGAQGAWYDPSDFSTLFQNSTGTTPVTAVEQPVRLMLDRSRGLVLGGELVSNGDFSNGTTGWIVLGAGTQLNSAFVVNGALQVSTTTEQNCATAVAVAAGKSIQIRFRARRVGATAVQCLIRASGNFGASSVDVHSFGNIGTDWVDYVCVFTNLAAATTRLTFREGSGGGGLYEIDDVSAKDLPGNHAVAPNDASRPILRARYNGFLNTDFALGTTTATNWTLTAPTGITATIEGRGVDANGRGYVDVRYVGTNTSGSDGFPGLQSATATAVAGGSYNLALTVSLIAGSLSGGSSYKLNTQWRQGADLFLSNSSGSSRTPTATPDRYVETHTAPVNTTGVKLNWTWTVANGASIDVTFRYAMASLLTAADQTATGGAYQRIAAATDYDTSNPVWRPYLAFDGSDDSLSTSSIDFSGTDKMTVFAGMHKASDAAGSVVLGHGVDDGTVGAFEFRANTAVNATTAFRGRSSAGSTATAGFTRDVAAPSTFVFASLVDYAAAAGAEFSGRYNGVVQAQNVGLTQENTGTFGNNVLTIGSRQGGALQRFNGRLYSLAVLGRTATAAELGAMEAWVAGKTGVTI